jgi:hypothetical protein
MDSEVEAYVWQMVLRTGGCVKHTGNFG